MTYPYPGPNAPQPQPPQPPQAPPVPQGWPQGAPPPQATPAQPQNYGSPVPTPQQAPPQQPSTPGLDPNAVFPNDPRIPIELRGRTVGEGLSIYGEMRKRFIDGLTRQYEQPNNATIQAQPTQQALQQQQQPSTQPQGAPSQYPQSQQTPQVPNVVDGNEFLRNPLPHLESVVERVMDRRMAPYEQANAAQQLQSIQQQMMRVPGYAQNEPAVLDIVQGLPMEQRVRPEAWQNALALVIGRRQLGLGGAQPQPQPQAPAAPQSVPPGGTPQSPYGPPSSYVTPLGSFFSEAPSPSNMGGQGYVPVSPDAARIGAALGFTPQQVAENAAALRQGRWPSVS